MTVELISVGTELCLEILLIQMQIIFRFSVPSWFVNVSSGYNR